MQNIQYRGPKNQLRGRLLESYLEELELEAHKMPFNHISFITKKQDVLNLVLTHNNKFFNIEKITSLQETGSDHMPVLIELGNVALNKPLKNIKLYNNKTKRKNC